MMAQAVPHQPTDRRRVKVYELRNNDWFDRGTGFCTATFTSTPEGQTDPRVIVESEDQPDRILLETKIQREDGFQKQQETLIVWQEQSGVDMALSFQESEGCSLIWQFVSRVQQALRPNIPGEDELANEILFEVPSSVTLPPANLENLQAIEQAMRLMTNSAAGRDALAKLVMESDYIGKLIPLVEMAEDLESLPDLHRLCNIMKTIILLNDTSIIEHAVSDECVFGVVGALEYDPDFPNHKANHRHWLDNKGHYKEVVPIDDEQTRRKIHQTYRLQYLKDVVLARILDDPTFSVLNSLIFFNQVDIVQHIQSNAPFLSELFGIFSSPVADPKKKKDAVLFIQQCCSIAKNIQPPNRQVLYNNLVAHGLLQVINFGLRHSDVGVRVGATDVLFSIIEHDPQMIRQTIYRQLHENQPPLTDSLIELLLIEGDPGVKSQITDALKVLSDQTIPPQGPQEFVKGPNGEMIARAQPHQPMDPQHELFLTYFYEQSAAKLFKPLLNLEHVTDVNFAPHHASMFTYLVDLLFFFVRQHHRFSRYFILNSNVTPCIAQLLRCPEKHLKLVAIRFLRSIVGLKEEFYVKHIISKQVLRPVLDVLGETMPKDNLVSSACLELFEFIKKETLRDVIKHLVENYRAKLIDLSYLPPLGDLVNRYDDTEGFTKEEESTMEPDEDLARKQQPPGTRMMEHIAIDPAEEEYWNTSDPEDEDDQRAKTGDKTLSGGPLTPSKPLVDYTSDEEGDENIDPEAAVVSAEGSDVAVVEVEDSTANQDTVADSTVTPLKAVATPPERLSEKRRREEDEEDEIDKLIANKRRNSMSSSDNSVLSPAGLARRKGVLKTGGSTGGTPPKRIAINLSSAVKTGGDSSSGDDS